MAYWRTGALGALGAILYILPCHFSEVDASGVARHLEECGYGDASAVALEAVVILAVAFRGGILRVHGREGVEEGAGWGLSRGGYSLSQTRVPPDSETCLANEIRCPS